MKKILTIMLVLAMLLTLAACAGSGTTTTSGSAGSSETSAPTTTEQGPPKKVVMTYLTQGFTPTDMELVVEEINKISREKINVEVEFLPIPIMDLFTGGMQLKISSGERMDLMMLAFTNFYEYVQNGSLEPLSDMLSQHAPTIMELKEEFPIASTTFDGSEIYGISPLAASYGTQTGYIFNKSWFEETGAELKDQYTNAEIGDMLAIVKANHPETYPMCITGGGMMSSLSLGYYFAYDMLGQSAASGVLMDFDSTTIVNGYETEEFYEVLTMLRDWYEAGYIPPDAATTTETIFTLGPAGVCGAYPMIMEPVQTSTTEASFGWETVALPITEGYIGSTSPNNGANWTVPITTEEPEAAIKFLDLMYEDHDVSNMILWGIEGTHFVKTDVDQVIAFPEGITGENSGYYNTFGLYGDRRYEYQWNVLATKPYTDAYTENNMKNQFKSYGYVFDNSEYSNEFVAISTVAQEYLPTLMTGSAADVEGLYNKFISDLKVAGIEKVIAANQAQFDEWLALNG